MDINELIERLTEARERLGNQPVEVRVLPHWLGSEVEQNIVQVYYSAGHRISCGGYSKPFVSIRCR